MRRALIITLVVFIGLFAAVGIYYAVTVSRDQAGQVTPQQLASRTEKVRVTFRVKAPDETPANQLLYISGAGPALGSWDAAGLVLDPQSDGWHVGAAELINSVEYAYKVTRGTWGTVERGPDDTDRPNRLITPTQDTEVEVVVAEWVDKGQAVPGRVTLAGDIRYHRALRGEALDLPRDLVVWLPPGYDEEPDRRYPVLYLQDGQNLFDESTSFAGVEWRVDETAGAMVAADVMEPIIIVGIANTEDRTAEFTPGTDLSAAYTLFLARQVKPMIDQQYRTRPDAGHTAIGGSGLGAIASLRAVEQHPDTFGTVVTLSPMLWGATPEMLEALSWDAPLWQGVRAWTDHGALAQRLDSAGARVFVHPAPEGERNEDEWAQSVPLVFKDLYGKPQHPPAQATDAAAAGAGSR